MVYTRQDIEAAMDRQDRKLFLPGHAHTFAALDRPISIGHGQTNSQPRTVADMLELLNLGTGQNVLDVGAGSGWTSAILGDLVGQHGTVTATELIPQLADRARATLKQCELPWVTLHNADPEHLGWPENAPYDRILVSAEARHLPASLVDQLREGGIMVIPVNTWMLRVVKQDGEPTITHHGRYSFVPLIGT